MAVITQILEIINATTEEFKSIPSIDRTLASKYNQKIEDIQEWLRVTHWSQKQIDKITIEKVQNQLHTLNIIEKMASYETIVK